MSAALLRSAGPVGCSGRSACVNSSKHLSRQNWYPRSATSRPQPYPIVPRSAGPDEVRSAPSLSDDEPNQENVTGSQAPSPPTNTANYTAMAALASVGVAETAYLTYVKLFNGTLVCPTNGCESVLNSPYGQLFGLPLSLYGMLAYGAVGALAVTYVRQATDATPPAARQTTLLGLTAGVAVLATTSAVLVSILQTRLGGTPCAWCYVSAALSTTLAVTLGSTLTGKQLKENGLGGVGAALATAAVLYVGLPRGGAGAVYDENFVLEYRTPVVSTRSSDRAIDLASRLTAVGARMYGAFWCSHCFEQKEEFGAAAMADFPYVECFPNGWKRGEKVAPLCEAANVRAFPTWIIGGKTIEGEMTLDEIEKEVLRAESAAALEVEAAPAVETVA